MPSSFNPAPGSEAQRAPPRVTTTWLAHAVPAFAIHSPVVEVAVGARLNLLNLPMMLAGEGAASPMAANPFILPTTILVTIVLAWTVIGLLAPRRRPADSRTTGARPAYVPPSDQLRRRPSKASTPTIGGARSMPSVSEGSGRY
jgi:hypothetical protein